MHTVVWQMMPVLLNGITMNLSAITRQTPYIVLVTLKHLLIAPTYSRLCICQWAISCFWHGHMFTSDLLWNRQEANKCDFIWQSVQTPYRITNYWAVM